MPPYKSILSSHSAVSDHAESLNIIVKLNSEILQELKNTLLQDQSIKPKLIVQNGEYFLKLSRDITLNTKTIKETSRMDLFSNKGRQNVCLNLGKIDMRLNIVHDSKLKRARHHLINSIERPKSELNSLRSTHDTFRTKSLPNSPDLRPVSDEEIDDESNNDKELHIIQKLIHLLALGPRNVDEIQSLIDLDAKLIYKFGAKYIESANKLKYSYYGAADKDRYVLKKRYYMRLSLYFFTEKEREIVLNNMKEILELKGYDERNSTRVDATNEYAPILTYRGRGNEESKVSLSSDNKLGKTKVGVTVLEHHAREPEKAKRNTVSTINLHQNSVPTIVAASESSDLSQYEKEDLKRKRTISESSNSSVTSVMSTKMVTDEMESPITSQEEVDEDISLNEIKRQKRTNLEGTNHIGDTNNNDNNNNIKVSAAQLEMFNKFQKKYTAYANLYQQLTNSKIKSRAEFKKFLVLETEIKTLKKKLWKL